MRTSMAQVLGPRSPLIDQSRPDNSVLVPRLMKVLPDESTYIHARDARVAVGEKG